MTILRFFWHIFEAFLIVCFLNEYIMHFLLMVQLAQFHNLDLLTSTPCYGTTLTFHRWRHQSSSKSAKTWTPILFIFSETLIHINIKQKIFDRYWNYILRTFFSKLLIDRLQFYLKNNKNFRRVVFSFLTTVQKHLNSMVCIIFDTKDRRFTNRLMYSMSKTKNTEFLF